MEMISHWRILLEVLILWYVIYMILLFIKGTRTEQLVKGLVIIGAIFILTQQLGLDAISWALTRILPISVVALLVIFQPELRRGLAQLGQFGIHQEDADVLDEVSRAAAALSQKRTGALIAIQREVGLKSYIETGTQIDSKVSSQLIVTIFTPPSPLHDGAVIIEGGRLVAAGCMLPLSQEEIKAPKTLGMRHKAAIGVSDETDAVCVVVSEETGAISVASGGKLTYGLDEENLTKLLKSIFYSTAQKMPFKISYIFKYKGKGKRN